MTLDKQLRKITIYLPEEVVAFLKTRKVPMSHWVRTIIVCYRKHWEDMKEYQRRRFIEDLKWQAKRRKQKREAYNRWKENNKV